jgi:Xaa-Pro dipeptidase
LPWQRATTMSSEQTSTLGKHFPEHIQVLLARHQDALEDAGLDAIAIFSGRRKVAFLDDKTYPFEANPHFKSWLPLGDLEDSWILFKPGDKPLLVYHQPDDYWHKPPADPDGFWTAHFEIRIISKPEHASRVLPQEPSNTAFIGEESELAKTLGFTAVNPEVIVNRLHYGRAAKTDYELDCMREASRLAALGHQAAQSAFIQGRSELEIHQAYLAASQHTDADLPYSSIVALNENAAVLHYQHLERSAPSPVRSFLIDAGCTSNGYASDITRSYSKSDDEFGELITAMDKRQREMTQGARSGVDYRQLHLSAHFAIAGVLQQFGLVNLEPELIVETGISSAFFPHGLGHLLGLQVHDVGGFQKGNDGGFIERPAGHPHLRLTRTLAANQVLTIEPGLYFIEPLLDKLKENGLGRHLNWKRVDQFLPYGGIRIEDDVVIAENGEPENLTRDAFRLIS